jgi:serine/threonine protein kinase
MIVGWHGLHSLPGAMRSLRVSDSPKTDGGTNAYGDAHAETLPAPASGAREPVPDFAPGSVVGEKYVVEREIGDGGLGVVVKARHVQLEHSVAIKYLKPFAVSMPGVVERFLREARLAAKIRSDHAVKVHDIGTGESGAPYMVMEYLEGKDLGQLIEASGPIGSDKAIDYVLQAIEALAEAHAAGIVHRDLKPDNLFLAQRAGGSSIVKVLDFGISKVRAKGRASLTSRRERLTEVNDRMGTPVFMSPEQFEGRVEVDARADIWALGVVLHELVTGDLPFDGVELPQLCAAVLSQPAIRLRAAMPTASPELEAIVLRCLEKDREKRYRNVAELAQDLAQLWHPETPSRIKHIARVIRDGGESIRPPTPFPGSIRLQPFPSEPPSVTTALASARPATLPTFGEIARDGRHGGRVVIGLLVLLGAAGIGGYALRVRPELATHILGARLPWLTAQTAHAPSDASSPAAPSVIASPSNSATARPGPLASSTASAGQVKTTKGPGLRFSAPPAHSVKKKHADGANQE